jgi:3-deoxy-7-phosphoheptulonate synthase
MIIQLKDSTTQGEIDEFYQFISDNNLDYKETTTQIGHYLIIHNQTNIDIRLLGNHPAVSDIHRVTGTFKLVSQQWKLHHSEISITENQKIGNGHFQLIAGPCAVENEDQIKKVVDFLVSNNIKIMRGGVFKPRSSPYAFRGMGIEGLKLMHKYCSRANISIISEVMKSEQIDEMYPYVDIFQVGARNSQNFNLLDSLGEIDKVVMIKRGLSGTLNELLHSAEYVFAGGNEKIILCERGIRTYENSYRNTLDLNAIPLLKEKTHLPVIVDPSHGTGIRSLVTPMSQASLVCGADGLMIEIHPNPSEALSDGPQSLNFMDSQILFDKIRKLNAYVQNIQ